MKKFRCHRFDIDSFRKKISHFQLFSEKMKKNSRAFEAFKNALFFSMDSIKIQVVESAKHSKFILLLIKIAF